MIENKDNRQFHFDSVTGNWVDLNTGIFYPEVEINGEKYESFSNTSEQHNNIKKNQKTLEENGYTPDEYMVDHYLTEDASKDAVDYVNSKNVYDENQEIENENLRKLQEEEKQLEDPDTQEKIKLYQEEIQHLKNNGFTDEQVKRTPPYLRLKNLQESKGLEFTPGLYNPNIVDENSPTVKKLNDINAQKGRGDLPIVDNNFKAVFSPESEFNEKDKYLVKKIVDVRNNLDKIEANERGETYVAKQIIENRRENKRKGIEAVLKLDSLRKKRKEILKGTTMSFEDKAKVYDVAANLASPSGNLAASVFSNLVDYFAPETLGVKAKGEGYWSENSKKKREQIKESTEEITAVQMPMVKDLKKSEEITLEKLEKLLESNENDEYYKEQTVNVVSNPNVINNRQNVIALTDEGKKISLAIKTHKKNIKQYNDYIKNPTVDFDPIGFMEEFLMVNAVQDAKKILYLSEIQKKKEEDRTPGDIALMQAMYESNEREELGFQYEGGFLNKALETTAWSLGFIAEMGMTTKLVTAGSKKMTQKFLKKEFKNSLDKYSSIVGRDITASFISPSAYRETIKNYKPKVFIVDDENGTRFQTQKERYIVEKSAIETKIENLQLLIDKEETKAEPDYSLLEEYKEQHRDLRRYLDKLEPTSLAEEFIKGVSTTFLERVTETVVGPGLDKITGKIAGNKAFNFTRLGSVRDTPIMKMYDGFRRTVQKANDFSYKVTGVRSLSNGIIGEMGEEVANVIGDYTHFIGQDFDLAYEDYKGNLATLADPEFYLLTAVTTIGQNQVMVQGGRALNMSELMYKARYDKDFRQHRKRINTILSAELGKLSQGTVRDIENGMINLASTKTLIDLQYQKQSAERETAIAEQEYATNKTEENAIKLDEAKAKEQLISELALFEASVSAMNNGQLSQIKKRMQKELSFLKEQQKNETSGPKVQEFEDKISYFKTVLNIYDTIERGTKYSYGRKNIMRNMQLQVRNDFDLDIARRQLKKFKREKKVDEKAWEDYLKSIYGPKNKNGYFVDSETNEEIKDIYDIKFMDKLRKNKNEQVSDDLFSMVYLTKTEQLLSQRAQDLAQEYRDLTSYTGQEKAKVKEDLLEGLSEDVSHLYEIYSDADKLIESKEFNIVLASVKETLKKTGNLFTDVEKKTIYDDIINRLDRKAQQEAFSENVEEALNKINKKIEEFIDGDGSIYSNGKKVNTKDYQTMYAETLEKRDKYKRAKKIIEESGNRDTQEQIEKLKKAIYSTEKDLEAFRAEENNRIKEEEDANTRKEKAAKIANVIPTEVNEEETTVVEENDSENKEEKEEIPTTPVEDTTTEISVVEETTETTETQNETEKTIPKNFYEDLTEEEKAVAEKYEGTLLSLDLSPSEIKKKTNKANSTIKSFEINLKRAIKAKTVGEKRLQEIENKKKEDQRKLTEEAEKVFRETLEDFPGTYEEFVLGVHEQAGEDSQFYKYIKHATDIWNEVKKEKQDYKKGKQMLFSVLKESALSQMGNAFRNSVEGKKKKSKKSKKEKEPDSSQVPTEPTEPTEISDKNKDKDITDKEKVQKAFPDVEFEESDFDNNGNVKSHTVAEAYKYVLETEEKAEIEFMTAEKDTVSDGHKVANRKNKVKNYNIWGRGFFSFLKTSKTVDEKGNAKYKNDPEEVNQSDIIDINAFLNPYKLKIGSDYTAEILGEDYWERYEIELKDGYKPTGNKILFSKWVQQEMEKRGMTLDEFKKTQDFKDNVPIVYVQNGKKVAFVTSPMYYDTDTLQIKNKKTIEEEREKTRIFRQRVFDGKNSFRLAEYNPSIRMKTKGGPKTLIQMMPTQSSENPVHIYTSVNSGTIATSSEGSEIKLPYAVDNPELITGEKSAGRMFILLPTHTVNEVDEFGEYHDVTHARVVLLNTEREDGQPGIEDEDLETLRTYLTGFASIIYHSGENKETVDKALEEVRNSKNKAKTINDLKKKVFTDLDLEAAFEIARNLENTGKQLFSLEETNNFRETLRKNKITVPNSRIEAQDFMQKYVYVSSPDGGKRGLKIYHYYNSIFTSRPNLKYNLKTDENISQADENHISLKKDGNSFTVEKMAESNQEFLFRRLKSTFQIYNIGTAEKPQYITDIQPSVYFEPANKNNVLEFIDGAKEIWDRLANNRAKRAVKKATKRNNRPPEDRKPGEKSDREYILIARNSPDEKKRISAKMVLRSRGVEYEEKPAYIDLSKKEYEEYKKTGVISKGAKVHFNADKVGKHARLVLKMQEAFDINGAGDLKIRVNKNKTKGITEVEVNKSNVEEVWLEDDLGNDVIKPEVRDDVTITDEQKEQIEKFINESMNVEYVRFKENGTKEDC